MDDNLLEITEYTGTGFRPLVFFESWRAAILNYDEENAPGKITKVEKHLETDEVFVLLAGKCTMLIGDGREDAGKIHSVRMEQGKLYNVRKGVWHNIESEPGTKLLIVENADTGPSNSKYIMLKKGEQEE